MRKLLALVAPLAVAGLMAAAAYGFMAANTVEPHGAGFGVGKVTGYNVQYQYEYWGYDSSGVAQVWGLQFYIYPAPTYEINVHLDGWFGSWYKYGGSSQPCSSSPASDGSNAFVFCSISPSVPLSSVNSLGVEAQDFP